MHRCTVRNLCLTAITVPPSRLQFESDRPANPLDLSRESHRKARWMEADDFLLLLA